MEPHDDPALAEVLAQSQERGFLGPGDPWAHAVHALAFAAALASPPTAAIDLGSGGGVPGLVLARAVWPDTRWALLDGSPKRTAFLVEAVEALGLDARVEVITARAEEAGREARHRGSYDLVVARSFGPPAVLAECSAPLLQVDGHLVVSEPPADPAGAARRWPTAGLRSFGLEPIGLLPGPPALMVLRQAAPCDQRWPRRVGIPGKRPAF